MFTQKDKKELQKKLHQLREHQNQFHNQYDRDITFDKPEKQQNTRNYGYWQLGFEFVLSILLFTFGGYYLDQKIGSTPAFFLLGLLFGFAAGLYRLLTASSS